MLSRGTGSCCQVLRRWVAVNASRRYSRVSPPPPAPAAVIRVSKNNLAFLGPPKKGPKPRQLLALPPFPADGSNPLPGRKNFPPAEEAGRAAARVTAITWAKHYFSDVPSAVIQSHFNKGLVSPVSHSQACPSPLFSSADEIASIFVHPCLCTTLAHQRKATILPQSARYE